MKNSLKVALLATALFATTQVHAQNKVDRDAKAVGHKTSEIAAKGKADIVDRKYDGKKGPHGQTIYIDKYSHYYYVNSRGHKYYMKKSQLRDR
jgi:Ni/Co efflux regulator RcnB